MGKLHLPRRGAGGEGKRRHTSHAPSPLSRGEGPGVRGNGVIRATPRHPLPPGEGPGERSNKQNAKRHPSPLAIPEIKAQGVSPPKGRGRAVRHSLRCAPFKQRLPPLTQLNTNKLIIKKGTPNPTETQYPATGNYRNDSSNLPPSRCRRVPAHWGRGGATGGPYRGGR